MSEYQKNSKKILVIYSIVLLIIGMMIGFFIGKHFSNRRAVSPVSSHSQAVCKTCNQIFTCEEAKKYLAAGCKDLDKDKDGIPCENLCKQGYS